MLIDSSEPKNLNENKCFQHSLPHPTFARRRQRMRTLRIIDGPRKGFLGKRSAYFIKARHAGISSHPIFASRLVWHQLREPFSPLSQQVMQLQYCAARLLHNETWLFARPPLPFSAFHLIYPGRIKKSKQDRPGSRMATGAILLRLATRRGLQRRETITASGPCLAMLSGMPSCDAIAPCPRRIYRPGMPQTRKNPDL